MKRTNLVLDEKILDEARRLAGARTYSEVVNLALRELVRRVNFAKIDGFANSGIWDGERFPDVAYYPPVCHVY